MTFLISFNTPLNCKSKRDFASSDNRDSPDNNPLPLRRTFFLTNAPGGCRCIKFVATTVAVVWRSRLRFMLETFWFVPFQNKIGNQNSDIRTIVATFDNVFVLECLVIPRLQS